MKRQNLVPALLAVAAVTLFALPATAAHLDNPNRLVNEGFEDPIANTTDPFVGRWQPFSLDGDEVAGGDTSQTSGAMPRSGASQLDLEIAGTSNSFAGAFQDVTLDPVNAPGSTAWFSGWAKLLSGDAVGSEIRIEWRDSNTDTEITRTGNLVPTLTSEYQEFIVSDTVPVGANSARVVYAIQSFGAGPDQNVLVDDVNFNVQIPEPTTVTLAALAGLAICGMRRRS